MATNFVENGKQISLYVGTGKISGSPVTLGKNLAGLCITDPDSAGYAAVVTFGVADFSVFGNDGAANSAVALYDDIYLNVAGALTKSNVSHIGSTTFTGTGLDDLTTGGTATSTKAYVVQIDATGTPDTFEWSDDGGTTFTTGVAITGSAQTLSDGVEVTFAATTGHTVADKWTFESNSTRYGVALGTVVAGATTTIPVFIKR